MTASAAVQILCSAISTPLRSRLSFDIIAPNTYLGPMTEYITVSDDDRVEARNGVIKLHGPDGYAGMRAAGHLAASILDALVPHVVPGVTTGELDDLVYRLMLDGGSAPATLGYRGYTKSCCVSITSRVPRHPATRRLERRHRQH